MKDIYDDVNSYMKHVKIFSNGLGPKQEKKLSRIIKHSNCPEAKNKAISDLVNGNLGLVIKCASDIHASFKSSSLGLMDLISEGNVWLFYAARNFSYRKKCRFSTYAYDIIRHHILNAVTSNTIIHIPYHILSYMPKVKALRDKYNGKLTRRVLIKEMGVSRDIADAIMDALKLKMSSLDCAFGDENTTFKDSIEDKGAPNPSQEIDRKDLKEYLDKISGKCLTEREKQVVELMFNADFLILDDIAAQVGVSRERVRQIYAKAIRKLRKKLLDEWDIDHKEDRIDNEELYKEVTGSVGFCYAYRMRNKLDSGFVSRLRYEQDIKGKKILISLLGKKTNG